MSKREAAKRILLVTRVSFVVAVGLVVGAANVRDASTATQSRNRTGTVGYSWPVKPFDQAHPVRANLGDPRTVYKTRVHGDALAGTGTFSFHNGVDIDAPRGSAVYPVESGVVHWVKRNYSLCVRADDGGYFVYTHISTAVQSGQAVTARVTVLGHVTIANSHLHFTEFSASGHVVNPLQAGHLTPYRDTTRPVVSALEIRAGGQSVAPFEVHGVVGLIAEAHDIPVVGHERFPVTRFAKDRFGVAPAVVAWSLSTLNGRTVIPKTTVVDFRETIPGNSEFWRFYARGTYQNRSVIWPVYHTDFPGRYLFWLSQSLDTTKFDDGVYAVTVTASDVRGNTGSLVSRIEVRNHIGL